jgi:HD-like signal output (HDOD) protein
MKLAGTVLEELWFAEVENEDENEKASESMAAKIGELEGLKPFPIVAQKVLAILSRPEFRVVEVTAALEEDPALAAGVLRVANSAFFAGAKRCSSIAQAFVRMGLMAVKESILAVTMMDMFPDMKGLGKRIRDHCAATAAIVQSLTRDFASQFIDGIFLCGLMHDVGKMLLIESGEVLYDTTNISTTLAPDQIHLDERTILGYDHAVLAGHVLKSWRIPEPIPKVVAWHHQATRAYQTPNIGVMVAMLRIADQLDWAYVNSPGSLEEVVETLGDGPDCTFANVETDALKGMIDKLYHARGDSLAMFGG